MKSLTIIFFVTVVLALGSGATTVEDRNLLAIETPSFFADQPSPLLKPKESLQKKEYYDFLSTLYRHDKTKANLFVPNSVSSASAGGRKKRTIIFRPLFVYRQQQVKRKKAKRY